MSDSNDVFAYRRPSAATLPLINLINQTEQEALLVLTAAARADYMTFDLITQIARRFWRVIDAAAPNGSDKNRALTALRLFRMRANDLIKSPAKDEVSGQYRSQSVAEQLADARMWACAAVALRDDYEAAIVNQCDDPEWDRLVKAARLC